MAVGFQHSLSLKERVDANQDLESCLNPWQVKESKQKQKSKRNEKSTNLQGSVEPIGKGSAVLLPTETGDPTNAWIISDDDESAAEEVIEVSSKPEASKGMCVSSRYKQIVCYEVFVLFQVQKQKKWTQTTAKKRE